jgi:hypothetical protein
MEEPEISALEKKMLEEEQLLIKLENEVANSVLSQFFAAYPPGTRDDFSPDYSFTTEEILQILNDHLPDYFTLRQIPILLYQAGYVSVFDKTRSEFMWAMKK